MNANRQIARAAGTVMIAIIFGQIMGLVRGIIVANIFGASPELDAFYAANRVSETLFLLVAGGALGSAFIPSFTGLLAKNDTGSAWQLASSLANAVTLTLILLAGVLAYFAPQVVRYFLAPGFSTDLELFSLATQLLRIQLISSVLFGLGGLIVGILNAHQIFMIPALTPAMYQIGIIFGAVFLTPHMGVHGLAWGVVIGAGLYVLVQIPILVKQRGTYTPTFGFKDANTRHVILLMGPRLIGVAVVQLNFWVNTWLASQMDEGSVTGLYYGFALMLMAQAAIAQSVAIAAMPTFSAQHALNKIDDMRSSLAASLRGILLMSLPASIGLMILREPLISFLYQRGEFDAQDVQIVSWSLLWYAVGLVGHSIMEVLTRAFYAQHDTKTPVVIGTVAMGLNVIFSFYFSKIFAAIGWLPLGGLALANSFATAIEAAALLIFMRKRLNGIEGKSIADAGWKIGLAGLGMALCLWTWINFTSEMSRSIVAIGGVVLGAVVYFASTILFKVPETNMLLHSFSSKFRRLRS